MRFSIRVVVGAFSALGGFAAAAGPLPVPLFDPVSGGVILEVRAVSNADSAVAVGRWFKPGDSDYRAYRYQNGVLDDLGLACLPDVASADGTTVAGPWCGDTGMYRWRDGVLEPLGDFGRVYDISADGSVVVGGTDVPSGGPDLAFRWSESEGLVSLGDLPGGEFASVARGVSADGSVVVGSGESPGFIEEAFRWEAGSMLALGDIPGGEQQSTADAVSADGKVVLGNGIRIGFHCCEAFRWTEETGIVGLGVFDGAPYPSQSNASKADFLSSDGRLVIGRAASPDGTQLDYVWDPAFGMRPLVRVLMQEFDLDPVAWAGKIENITAISKDARVIAGSGGEFPTYAWMAVLPHPPGRFGCDVAMDALAYADGDTVRIERLRFGNFGGDPLATRLRLQLDVPGLGWIDLLDLGAAGGFAIPAGFFRELAPVVMFAVQPSQPRGVFTLRCALEDAASGRVQAEDLVPFRIE